MARIVNVIHKPHFVTYLPMMGAMYRCCDICEYEVIVELDNGELCPVYKKDFWSLREFDIEYDVKNAINRGTECGYYPLDSINDKDVNIFIHGFIENGDEPLEAIGKVFRIIRESGVECSKSVKELLEKIKL